MPWSSHGPVSRAHPSANPGPSLRAQPGHLAPPPAAGRALGSPWHLLSWALVQGCEQPRAAKSPALGSLECSRRARSRHGQEDRVPQGRARAEGHQAGRNSGALEPQLGAEARVPPLVPADFSIPIHTLPCPPKGYLGMLRAQEARGHEAGR